MKFLILDSLLNQNGTLHLLEKRRFPDPEFFTAFHITEEDLTSKGRASYAPIERIKEMYSDNLLQCPIVPLYPRPFGLEKFNAFSYSKAKKSVIEGNRLMCVLCRADYLDTDEVIVGDCKHAVHFKCFKQLGKVHCPICFK